MCILKANNNINNNVVQIKNNIFFNYEWNSLYISLPILLKYTLKTGAAHNIFCANQ